MDHSAASSPYGQIHSQYKAAIYNLRKYFLRERAGEIKRCGNSGRSAVKKWAHKITYIKVQRLQCSYGRKYWHVWILCGRTTHTETRARPHVRFFCRHILVSPLQSMGLWTLLWQLLLLQSHSPPRSIITITGLLSRPCLSWPTKTLHGSPSCRARAEITRS